MKFSALTAAIVGSVALTACTMQPTSTNTNSNTASGALAGAAIGAIGGAIASDGNDKVRGAVLGAAIGGTTGAIIGSALDKQEAELRGSMGDGRVQIINTGNELIVRMPQDILFATGSDALAPALTQDLYALAANLNRYPNTRVDVIGHTDNVGSAAFNQTLSERRAASVAAVLRQGGVAANRIVAYGRGLTQPIASNATEAGRSQNRRVDIVIRPVQ